MSMLESPLFFNFLKIRLVTKISDLFHDVLKKLFDEPSHVFYGLLLENKGY